MITPAPDHGKIFLATFMTQCDERYNLVFRFNGFEFKTPYSQSFHEAKVFCINNHKVFRGIVVVPLNKAHSFLRKNNGLVEE